MFERARSILEALLASHSTLQPSTRLVRPTTPCLMPPTADTAAGGRVPDQGLQNEHHDGEACGVGRPAQR